MAFPNVKSLPEVLSRYEIRYEKQDFKVEKSVAAPVLLAEEIRFNLDEIAVDVSEAAICELLINPILRAAWKPFADVLAFWIRQPIQVDNDMAGVPDYMFSKRSKRGKIVLETP